MVRNVGHICFDPSDPDGDYKYCLEGANPNRHVSGLPANHPSQHDSHRGGCICELGDGEVHECQTDQCATCEDEPIPQWFIEWAYKEANDGYRHGK